eukprot:471763_1
MGFVYSMPLCSPCINACTKANTGGMKRVRNNNEKDIITSSGETTPPPNIVPGVEAEAEAEPLSQPSPDCSLHHKTMKLLSPCSDTTLPPTNPHLEEDIVSQSHKRLSLLIPVSDAVADMRELQDVIRESYDKDDECSIDSEGDVTADSSIDEEEAAAIQQAKSERQIPVGTPSAALYRRGTTTAWDENEIDDLHNDMEEQMRLLTRRVTPVEAQHLHQTLNSPHLVQFGAFGYGNMHMTQPRTDSGLFRDSSAEHWKAEDLDKQKEDMIKEMGHLMSLQQKMSSID